MINLYTVFDESGKEPTALYGTPGLTLFAAVGGDPIRGTFASKNGRAFTVCAGSFYEVLADGSSINYGSLNSNFGAVTIDENPFQLMVCDGVDGYIFTYATNAFVQITSVNFPDAGTVTFIDGYFVVNKVGTGSFYISAINDGLTWGALDFATAESSPDNLVRVLNTVGQLWLFGESTTEIWTNSGDSVFPFERISGAKMETGILAPDTAIAMDNTVFWVGRDTLGHGIVYRARGFTPQRVSTSSIEYAIQNADNLSEMRAYTYQQQGHVFYVLTGGGLATTLVYDVSTQLWHERAFLEIDGTYGQHLGCCGMFAYAFNKQLIGDRVTGNIYGFDLDEYTDNGSPLRRERVFTHLNDESKRIRYSSLEVGFETGVGLTTGQGSDPQCVLQISQDGGRTWSIEFTRTIGKIGAYMTKVAFRRLGIAREMTFRIKITDPVKVAITGAYLNV